MLVLIFWFQLTIDPTGKALCWWACSEPAGALCGQCGMSATQTEGQRCWPLIGVDRTCQQAIQRPQAGYQRTWTKGDSSDLSWDWTWENLCHLGQRTILVKKENVFSESVLYSPIPERLVRFWFGVCPLPSHGWVRLWALILIRHCVLWQVP